MRFCLWITGLPGSGKSTVADEVKKRLGEWSFDILILNLDRIRKVLTPEPKYTDEERNIVYRSLVYMSKLLVEEGNTNIIIDATGNRVMYRNLARELIPEFAEVFLKCPLDVCQKREGSRHSENVEKNLYQKAGSGQLNGGLPGVTAPYEESEHPEIVIDSHNLSPQEAAEEISDYVLTRWRPVVSDQ
jgi:adenylylsulfate kinase